MTSSLDNHNAFFEALGSALYDQTFIKLILSKPEPGLRWRKIIVAKFLDAKGTPWISVEYFDMTQTERVNIPYERALSEVQKFLPEQMRAGHLKTVAQELMLERTVHNSFRLKQMAITKPPPPVPSHNREKHYSIPADSQFLVELGIASPTGGIRRDRYDKFRQIQKFVEIIADLVPAQTRSNSAGLSVVDFGSGKHYLTFALHAFLSQGSAATTVQGIERRSDLVSLGQAVANKLSAKNLSFIEGSITEASLDRVDLVVALHACNTATDDALAKAVRAQARFICVAPCCHAYVRNHLTTSDDLNPMLRHGIVEERFAESLTDSLRVLLLEALGYRAKLFEFISPEHTAKNTMITAHWTGQKRLESRHAMQQLRAKFGLQDFYLDASLSDLLG
jgi:hypothetical protein